jgi:UDP-galactopyranose mutase
MIKIKSDYVVVGTGLTGAVIARQLHDAGREVVVLDKREHMGGNVHDYVHPSGIRIHTYGPHYFRTSSDELWDYVQRFSSFYKYEAAIKSFVDDNLENWPIAASYIRNKIGEVWEPEFKGTPTNFEEASLSMMPKEIFTKFVKGYSEKQWGISTKMLSPGLAKRFDVRIDDEPRLMRHKHQGLPIDGYAVFMQKMLAGLPVILGVDYLKNRPNIVSTRHLIFTGPIDEYYDCLLGRLHYRGQTREHIYYPESDLLQPCGQINNPDPQNGAHIRSLEWKHMMEEKYSNRIRGTVVTKETTVTPTNSDNFEYPFPDQANAALYSKYREMANGEPRVTICGRLGEYKYYDMDQSIARALQLSKKILSE